MDLRQHRFGDEESNENIFGWQQRNDECPCLNGFNGASENVRDNSCHGSGYAALVKPPLRHCDCGTCRSNHGLLPFDFASPPHRGTLLVERILGSL